MMPMWSSNVLPIRAYDAARDTKQNPSSMCLLFAVGRRPDTTETKKQYQTKMPQKVRVPPSPLVVRRIVLISFSGRGEEAVLNARGALRMLRLRACVLVLLLPYRKSTHNTHKSKINSARQRHCII